MGVADVVEELLGTVIEAGPSPTAGGDAGSFQVLLVVVEGAEVFVDLLGDAAGGLAVAAEDREIQFMVFQSTDGKGEVHLEGADGGVDLVGDSGIGGVGNAEFFELGEDAVALVDVAGVELEVFLMGFVGNFAGFSLHFGQGLKYEPQSQCASQFLLLATRRYLKASHGQRNQESHL